MAEIPDENGAQIVNGRGKGKRTQRRLRFDPCAADSSSADNCSSSSAGVPTEEEEQDLAKCLILLAQGRTETEQFVVVAERDKSLFLYQCKTCDRCFNSFQALGGHRASHKKPKISGDFTDGSVRLSLQLSTATRPPPPPLLPAAVVKSKIHECSVCGAEFSSGQALGGHMRRHRASTATTATTPTTPHLREFMIKKERNVLGLDLNLPAPEEDRHRVVVAAVFSAASPLVDCHY